MLKVATRGVIVLGMMWAGTAYAAPENWRVSEKSGTVSILHSGVSRIALQGNGVATGDLVSTGANGRAVLVRGQEYVVVAPNSRLRIADPAQSGGVVQIIQDVGNVIFKIKRMATPHFAVQTPYLAAVVKGTTFSVTVGEAGASVQVIEGAVEVKTSDGLASELIKPGMIAAVSASDRFSLRVDGDTSHVVRSPSAPASGADTAQYENSSASAPAEEVKIESPITETAQSVGDLTGGLIEGTTALSASMSVASTKLAIETVAQSAIATPASTAFEAPVVTATAPVIVAAAPVVTATAPVIVAAAPVVIATAPVIVAAAPVVTATAPVIVAAAPVVIATAPVIVAAAPVVTATAPVIVAAAPVIVAIAPVIVAAAPVVTSLPPVTLAAVVAVVQPVLTGLGNGNNGNGNANGLGNGTNGNGNAFGHLKGGN